LQQETLLQITVNPDRFAPLFGNSAILLKPSQYINVFICGNVNNH